MKLPTDKHNPTSDERDERVTELVGLDPEEVLEAVLKVDPESEPARPVTQGDVQNKED